MNAEEWIDADSDGRLPSGLPDGLYEAALELLGGFEDQPLRLDRLRCSKETWSREEGGEISPRYRFVRVRWLGE
jgi:hypothetical protein